MGLDFATIDPAFAWKTYEPSAEVPWTRARAAHLFRRAGFAASSSELDDAVEAGPSSALAKLLHPTSDVEAFNKSADRLAETASAGGSDKIAAAWLYRLLGTPDPLREKMTLFWHGHFATSAEKVQDARLMLEQNELLRRHALGKFDALVQEISHDPAMLLYLDSASNRKAHPNENYARELMELFCLGEGNYTEQDVREVARCFTGWEVRRDRYRFNRYEHDSGTKSFLGATGEFGGDDAVRIILEQPQAAEFIAGKLVRYFVCDEPAPTPELLRPLSAAFRDSGYDVASLVEQILGSNLFFSDDVMGRKVRSPVDFAVGLMRALEGSANVNMLATGIAEIGQSLLYPPNVAGWEGGRSWIDSSTLLGRANLVDRLLHDPATRFAGAGLVELVKRENVPEEPEAIVAWLAELLLAVPISDDVRDSLVDLAAKNREAHERRLRNVVQAICSLPEFQLG